MKIAMPALAAALIVLGLVVGGVFVPHARAYFFLFDDYALIWQASDLPVREIVARPLFGFYRPIAFLFTKAEFSAFGGWSPAAFAASALALHVVNALLAGVVAHRLRVSAIFSLATAGCFLLSPWAGEAFFWTSARFDLLAACAMLLTIGLADLAADGDRGLPARAACVAGTVLASVLALLSKEAAVVLPLLVVLHALMKPGAAWRDGLRWRAGALALVTCAVGLYLWRRQAVLPGLSGVYGNFATLMAHGDLPRHVGQYAASLVWIPMPADWSWSSLALTWLGRAPFLIVSLPLLLWLAIRRAWRHAALCALAFVCALAPVSWAGMTPANTASGRLLYFPGVFFALLLARGVHELFAQASPSAREPGPGRVGPGPPTRTLGAIAWLGAIVVPVVYFTGSLHHQQRMWSDASRLARLVVRQFEPLVGRTEPVFVTNLPFWFIEGPFVLKSYAFQCYYAPRPVPPVRAAAMVLAYDPAAPGVIREIARVPEPGATTTTTASGPEPGETPVTFTLPLQPLQTGAAAAAPATSGR